MQEFIVEAAAAGKRADVYLAGLMPDYSRSVLAKLFDGKVTINGKPATVAHKLKAGDKLEVNVEPLTRQTPKTELPVIFENEDVIVVNKPPGILTHAKGGLNSEATVASFIAPKYKLGRGENLNNKTGIIHRLDRDTSGIIITAKNQAAQRYLQKQFAQHKVQKIYIAMVEGKPEPAEAIIDAPIVRNPKKPQTFKVTAEGKPAQTRYRTLSSRAGNSILELQPTTGRTHQLRVHLSYIGHPIVGDRFYGNPAKRLKLHAKSIDLKLPGGIEKRFSTGRPDFLKITDNRV